MLTDSEYQSLLPYKESLFQGTARKTELKIINTIFQRLRYQPICFDCSGSIARAVTDITGLIEQYEKCKK